MWPPIRWPRALGKHLRSGKSGIEEDTPEGRVFLTVHVPPPRLVITGAVHISQALAPIGKMLDYDVTIVDPRTAFATPERFPDVNLIAEWPDVALPPIGIDRYTAFVALTHDPKIDDPGLTHGAQERLLLYRRARLAEDAWRAAWSGSRRSTVSATTTSAASMRRSASISARCRRPRSRWRSWARSPRACAAAARLGRAA